MENRLLISPPGPNGDGSDDKAFTKNEVLDYVKLAKSNAQYASTYRTQWVAQAYVFYGWALYAKSSSCGGHRRIIFTSIHG